MTATYAEIMATATDSEKRLVPANAQDTLPEFLYVVPDPQNTGAIKKVSLPEIEQMFQIRFTNTLWAPECLLEKTQETRARRKSKNTATCDPEAFMLVNMGEYGYGLFARKDIPENTFLFHYTGEYSGTAKEGDDSYKMDIADSIFGWKEDSLDYDQLDPPLTFDFELHGTIDALYYRNLAAFMQHLPSPYQLQFNVPDLDNEAKMQVATANATMSRECDYIQGLACRAIHTLTAITAGSIIGIDYGWRNAKQQLCLFDKQGNTISQQATQNAHSRFRFKFGLNQSSDTATPEPSTAHTLGSGF